MKVGVVVSTDPWRYFTEIYEDWQARYPVRLFAYERFKAPIFNTRINRYLFNRELENFLKSQDVVFFEWASDLLVKATQMPKTTRIVTRIHRYEMFNWVHQVNWDHVDRVILVSRAMQEKFAERFPDHAHKTVVVTESVDTSQFQPFYRPFNGDIGTLCFMGPRKRVYELILAFAELDSQHPGFRLHIGGGGNKHEDYNDALRSLVRKLNLGDKVIFYGDVNDAACWYHNIDIFVSNSYSEGLQVAPMEAMASGRYVLSHHWDGADQLLPEEQLYLTDRELIEKILAYASKSEAEQRQVQEKMRHRACSHFDLEIIKQQIRAVLEDAAGGPPVNA